MVTGVIALVTALLSFGIAYLGYRERHAETPTEKVDKAKKKIDEEEEEFKKTGRPPS